VREIWKEVSMVGADDVFSLIPLVETQNLWAEAYWGILSSPLDMVKWIGIISKHSLETKKFKGIYSKVLKIRVTHTMISRLITPWSNIQFYYRTKSRS
jgi:hypothetical protein